MGKSTFDVDVELRRIREREEEQRRKEAIAKGEMTEDGKEIAQEVAVEDCEIEAKREWKQVPTEELEAMFDESDEPGDPHAEGVIIDDIDLTQYYTKGEVTYDFDDAPETAWVEVENNKGSLLPSTGGIGTTIFYIVGGLLVIGAAVILVARRKSHE